MKHLKKFTSNIIKEYLNENHINDNLSDIIYGDNFHIFKDKIKSYHGRIEDGLIVRFYLKEFLKHYNISDLGNIKNWDEFIKSIHNIWKSKIHSKNEIVFRRGDINEDSFFSNNIYVASVYSGPLNAYVLNFKTPYILDCKDSDWDAIPEPKIMKGISYDGTVSTDNIVKFIKNKKPKYDGIILLNLYEGSGAGVFGPSNIYISLNNNNILNLTNNLKTIEKFYDTGLRKNIIATISEYLNENIDNNKDIIKFIGYLEHYQSNHYNTFNRKLLVDSYNNLPERIKKIINSTDIDNLYRGLDGLSYKSAISFTNNKDYADTFGVYTVPFTELKEYSGLIDTQKLVKFLDKNRINHDIGDDEGEVIVLNPIFNDDLNKKLENYRN